MSDNSKLCPLYGKVSDCGKCELCNVEKLQKENEQLEEQIKKYILERLKQAKEICDKEDRSTEYMIQFMQDYAGVSFDDVMDYLTSLSL